jgi:hypothetical protein
MFLRVLKNGGAEREVDGGRGNLHREHVLVTNAGALAVLNSSSRSAL